MRRGAFVIIYLKKIFAVIVAMTAAAVLPFSVFADGEAELLDRNRNQGIGYKSYAEIIVEATADIDLQEYESVIGDIEICAEEYELVYEYCFDDLQTFPKAQYDEIIKNSRGTTIYVPIKSGTSGARNLVGQIYIHCKDGEIDKVRIGFSRDIDNIDVRFFRFAVLEQRALLEDVTAVCKEKGATQVMDAFFMYVDYDCFEINAMLIETDIGTLVYDFSNKNLSDKANIYTLDSFVMYYEKRADDMRWTFWDFARWYGYLPIIIPVVALVLLAIIVITVILITKKIRRKRVTPTATK